MGDDETGAGGAGPAVYLAFRFHTNFYHSYRGDSPDELGFGKDIRIIASILDDLDRLNAEGVPVKGTWDIENYYTLEKLMPAHCPELLARIRARVAAGRDAVCPMSYDNGIVSACDEEEFRRIADWTLSNPAGSGIADLFASWEPVLRPQECMYTPSFLRLYPERGIGAISLYYSSHPFNGFSTFVPELSFSRRYNPIRLASSGIGGEMTLLPCYNHGDIADRWLSLRRWLLSMRKKQLELLARGDEEGRRDLLLTIDMDADDEFWAGMKIPFLSRLFPSFDGLFRMVGSLAGLPWLRFCTPGEYLASHGRVGELSLDQDTADGSFDGYSSWAEKWENAQVWSRVQRSRIASRYAALLAGGELPPEAAAALDRALNARILTLSTTHFGLSSPIMNARRLEAAYRRADEAVEASEEALRLAASVAVPRSAERGAARGSGPRGAAVRTAVFLLPSASADSGLGSGALVRLDAKDVGAEASGAAFSLADPSGFEPGQAFRIGPLRAVSRGQGAGEEAEIGVEIGLILRRGGDTLWLAEAANEIDNGIVRLRVGEDGEVQLLYKGEPVFAEGYPVASLRYGGTLRRAAQRSVRGPESLSPEASSIVVEGTVPLGRGRELGYVHRYIVASGLPYVYVDVFAAYPETEHRGYDRRVARRLGATWDGRWREVMPFELAPLLGGGGEPIRIWKRNFFGDLGSYRLDYGSFSRNRELDSFNNHLTNAWVAASRGGRGLLLAQSCLYDNSFAFCPMRLREEGGKQRLFMNPFGTYHGRQLEYQASATGLGRALALRMADHLRSYAPSYNGRVSRFSLMIAPYAGDEPDEGARSDAELFSTPPLALPGARGAERPRAAEGPREAARAGQPAEGAPPC